MTMENFEKAQSYARGDDIRFRVADLSTEKIEKLQGTQLRRELADFKTEFREELIRVNKRVKDLDGDAKTLALRVSSLEDRMTAVEDLLCAAKDLDEKIGRSESLLQAVHHRLGRIGSVLREASVEIQEDHP